jgi:MFS family permease
MPGTNSRSWQWLDEGVIPLASSLAYAAWAYPAFAVYMRDPLTGSQNPGFTFWLCLGLLLGASASGRFATRIERGALLVVGGGFAAIAIALGAILIPWLDRPGPWLRDVPLLRATGAALVCTLLLWWRGVRLAYVDHHQETMGTFVVGTLALAAMVLLTHARHGPPLLNRVGSMAWLFALLVTLGVGLLIFSFSMFLRVDQTKVVSAGEAVVAVMVVLLSGALPLVPEPTTLSGPIVLFVFSGLLARSLLSLSWVLNTQRGHGGVRLRVDPGWLVVILSLTGAIVLLGLGLGQVLTPDAVRGLLRALRVIWMPVLAVLAFVFLSAAWVVLRVLSAIMSRLGLAFPEPPPEPPPEAEELTGRALDLPPLVQGGIGVLVVLALLALVGWILYRVARRLSAARHAPATVSERRRPLFSLDLLQAQLRRALGGLRRSRTGPFVPLDPGPAARRAVRLAYRRVLSRAMGQGLPRDRDQTPRAYAERLARLSPQLRSLLQSLTAAYEAARYGTVPPSADEVHAAEDASLQIEGALRARPDQADVEE